MSIRAPILALAAAFILASACAEKEELYAPPDYAGWRRTTELKLDYPIPGHMDRYRIPRMNAIGFRTAPTVERGKPRWDFLDGTIIVKEVYAHRQPAPGEKPVQLTIMAKDPEDKRSLGGWLWLTKDLPNGEETVFEGNFCVTCHANANEKHPYGDGNPKEEFRDFVFFVPGEPLPAGTPASKLEAGPKAGPEAGEYGKSY
jgi:hypothetical protein